LDQHERSSSRLLCSNREQIPHLRISNLYKDIIASGNTQSSEVKDYIRDKIRSGKFLIRSIHQPQQTIFNIAQQIVVPRRAKYSIKPHAAKILADRGKL
jgi:RNA polymerase sigma-54 factor